MALNRDEVDALNIAIGPTRSILGSSVVKLYLADAAQQVHFLFRLITFLLSEGRKHVSHILYIGIDT